MAVTWLVACSLAGCVGVFADDGSSVSLGTHARGALLRGVVLPETGAGYEVPPPWRERHRQYSTEEVVRWLTGAFRRVAAELPGSVAQVGDLSRQGGGASLEHKSHGSGRDIDIFFYAMDPDGNQVRSERAAFRFGADGEVVSWSMPAAVRERWHGRLRALHCRSEGAARPGPLPQVRFDARRNWALVRAMLTDPSVEVQWIFIQRALGELMLREGPVATDDPALVARAAALMHQPSDAQAHDDHMHVRVYCEPSDRALGCVDRGPLRWWKKRWKDLARAAEPDRSDAEAVATAPGVEKAGPAAGEGARTTAKIATGVGGMVLAGSTVRAR